MGRGTGQDGKLTRRQEAAARVAARERQRAEKVAVVHGHPAVDPKPTISRWMRVPGWEPTDMVTVEPLPDYVADFDQVGFSDLYMANLGEDHQVLVDKRPEDRFVAWFSGWAGGPALGATPQEAIDTAVANVLALERSRLEQTSGISAAAAEMMEKRAELTVPTAEQWAEACREAEHELANRVRMNKRKWTREDQRGKRAAEPPMRGWLTVEEFDTPTYDDDGDPGDFGHSYTDHAIELTRARPAKKQQFGENPVPRLYDGDPDRVWVVKREYSDTNYDTYTETGLVQLLGAFDNPETAEAYAELRRPNFIAEDEITVVELPVE